MVTAITSEALSPRAFTAAQRAFAAAAWPLRAADELRLALVFRALARAGRRVGLPAALIRRCDEAMADELNHARLCAALGRALDAPPPPYDATPIRRRVAALPDAQQRAAALLLADIAMGETLSTSLFRAGRRDTTDPLARSALTVILADEVRHQRLGWEGIATLWPALSARQRDGLQIEATNALAAFESEIAVPALRWLDRGKPFDPACAALGVLAPASRVAAFYDTLEQLIVPRLSRLGLDGARAWRDRYHRH